MTHQRCEMPGCDDTAAITWQRGTEQAHTCHDHRPVGNDWARVTAVPDQPYSGGTGR